MDRKTISDRTGFDAGDLFESDEQVRRYFQAVDPLVGWADDIPQDELDEMAAAVIANRWHMIDAHRDSSPPGPTTVWMHADTKRDLQRLATATQRTLSATLRVAIRFALSALSCGADLAKPYRSNRRARARKPSEGEKTDGNP